MKKVTLYRDDFTAYSWFYMLREIGLLSNELDFLDLKEDMDEWAEFLPQYADLFKESVNIELDVNDYTFQGL